VLPRSRSTPGAFSIASRTDQRLSCACAVRTTHSSDALWSATESVPWSPPTKKTKKLNNKRTAMNGENQREGKWSVPTSGTNTRNLLRNVDNLSGRMLHDPDPSLVEGGRAATDESDKCAATWFLRCLSWHYTELSYFSYPSRRSCRSRLPAVVALLLLVIMDKQKK
jgi:hypothetical protein